MGRRLRMIAKKILLPSVVATSLMTWFSYLITETEKKNFSESELLAKIEKRKLGVSKQIALPAGWATHYMIGIIMTLFFYVTWKQFKIKTTLSRGITSSVPGGLIAIVSWRILFTALPKRSHNYYKKFYTQLFMAHVLFAFTVIAVQKATCKISSYKSI
jgi:hypothetical protein